jgi:anti-sigma regulatory factor (Ser/Thr protein kinase)
MSGWPLVTEVPPLGALPTAPGTARARVRAAAAAWQLDDDVAEAGELVTSELVTNAVQASNDQAGRPLYVDGRLPLIWLRLLSDGTRLIIEVWDTASGYPQPRPAVEDATDGRGLHLVNHLTGRQWGWQPAHGGYATKCVWAELAPGAMAGMAELIA